MKCRYSKAQIIAILQEYDSGLSPSIVTLCAKYGVSRQAYYNWRAKYGQSDGGSHRLIELESEVGALRRLVNAQISLVEDLKARLSQFAGSSSAANAAASTLPAWREPTDSHGLPLRQAGNVRPLAAA